MDFDERTQVVIEDDLRYYSFSYSTTGVLISQEK